MTEKGEGEKGRKGEGSVVGYMGMMKERVR